MAVQSKAYVCCQQEVTPGCFLVQLTAGDIARRARPGQFVHVRCGDEHDPLLRRPISLHRINPAAGEISLLFRVVGRGTKKLSAVQAGETLDLVGPLGNGFDLQNLEPYTDILLVGGGIGAAPLFALAEELVCRGIKPTVFLGAATSVDLIQVDAFRSLGGRLLLATDDGSEGWKGTVVDCFNAWLEKAGGNRRLLAFACGPRPMQRSLQQLCRRIGINLQLAIEERMGCGVGACLACVCRVKDGKPPGWKYARVCQEGPVFWGEEVLLDD